MSQKVFVAALIALLIAGVGFWYLSYQSNPTISKIDSLPSFTDQNSIAASENPSKQGPDQNATAGNEIQKPTPSSSNNALYSDTTFGFSFEYPKNMTVNKMTAHWISKAAYTAWMSDPNNAGGIGVNNLVSFAGNTVNMRVSVAQLGHYNAYETMFYPETDQSLMVNGIKVYRTTAGSATYVYWQNSHRSQLETLWNAVEVSPSSNAEAKVVADLVANSLRVN